jgi:threonine dehydrogenase-like Zn-dependent dehydrogenase
MGARRTHRPARPLGPQTVLITGAGPIGLLAAMLAVQRGLPVHVLDRTTEGPKPELVRALGGVYHVGKPRDTGVIPDVLLECTGVDSVIVDVLDLVAPGGIVCLRVKVVLDLTS